MHNMFLKTEKMLMEIKKATLVYRKGNPAVEYLLESRDGKIQFKTIPEPAKYSEGIWRGKGVVSKYACYGDFSKNLMTSYTDCIVTYTRFKKRVKSVLVDNQEVYK